MTISPLPMLPLLPPLPTFSVPLLMFVPPVYELLLVT